MNNEISRQRWDLIERYHRNELEKEDLASFERSMKTDPSLQEDVNNYKLTIQGIKEHAFKMQLSEKRLRYKSSEATSRTNHYLPYAIGIAALLILSFSFYFWDWQDKPASFEAYYEPFPDVFTTRKEANDVFHLGMKAYSSKNYTDAAVFFQQNKDLNFSIASLFYLAQVELLVGKPKQALEHLLAIHQKENEFSKETTWYIALTYLKMKDVDNTLLYLNKIKTGDFNYELALSLKTSLLESVK